MKIRIRDLRVSLDYKDNELKKLAAYRLGINKELIKSIRLVKKAVDARRTKVCFSCTVDVDLADSVVLSAELLQAHDLLLVEETAVIPLVSGNCKLNQPPVIIGSGPAGLFCALDLARHGYNPIVLEQGQDMDRRIQTVQKFWQSGQLDSLTNVQFGEGGAGTFSDGKLTTRIGDSRVDYVLETFSRFGADEEILYLKKPHVGTDVVRSVVKKIRQEIIRLGGEFYFEAELTDINVNHGRLNSIIINSEEELPCSLLVLAMGNSARKVYRMLHHRGIRLIPKSLAVGVRIEHPQDVIDKMQFGEYAGHPRLPVSDYHFTYQDKNTGRSLYTFCMCPGGYVIAAASAPGQLVINGMSYFKRDSGIANSALVVTVSPRDWGNEVLGGINLQEELEKKAFQMGGGNYQAPAQYLQDFLECKPTRALDESLASYIPGVTPSNLWDMLPQEIAEVMRRGLETWGRRAKGFLDPRAVMTGVETRTSAPLRIERDETMCSVGIPGLYPCGEGAGYAGGIVSAAVDGLKIAEKIIVSYQRPTSHLQITSQVVKGSSL